MQTPTQTVIVGDCRDVLRTMAAESIDAVVTDPPYDLSFMGKAWDGTGVAFDAATWAAAYRVLKPGAHLLAFGGTRTYHRMVCAIEDAGFEIRDTIPWVYGSGFPKSLDIGKAMDKRGGRPDLAAEIGRALKQARQERGMSASECDRLFCGGTTNWSWFEGRPTGQRAPTPQTFALIAEAWPEVAHLAAMVDEAEREFIGKSVHKSGIGNGVEGHYTVGGTRAEHYDITAPATDLARQWDGWGSALKPSHEPIVLARKPLAKGHTIAANVAAFGTGGLNIDASRIDGTPRATGTRNSHAPSGVHGVYGSDSRTDRQQRYDANLPSGRWPANLLLDAEAGALLDTMSGGEVSRFFARLDFAEGEQEAVSRLFYSAKASRRERNAGLEGMPEQHGFHKNTSEFRYEEGREPTPRAHTSQQNHHPTVKPIALMRYLITLITPPGGTVLDMFAGSGTTGCAAALLGFNFVGIEQSEEYAEIARRRIAHWAAQREDHAPPSLNDLPLFGQAAD